MGGVGAVEMEGDVMVGSAVEGSEESGDMVLMGMTEVATAGSNTAE